MSDTVIVVPCYDEARRLDVDAFSDFVDRCDSIDFLFVDDGSRDSTFKILSCLVQRHAERFSVLSFPRNHGKGEAVRRGMLRALAVEGVDARCAEVSSLPSGNGTSKPVYVGYWDADLATPLRTILAFRDLLHERQEVELVLGSRVHLLGRQILRKRSRHYMGRLFSTMASHVLGVPIYDSQCGAKLFRVLPSTRELLMQAFDSRWVFDVELLARMRRQSSAKELQRRIYEYPLETWQDIGGSKIRWRDGLRALWDVAGMYWRFRSIRNDANGSVNELGRTINLFEQNQTRRISKERNPEPVTML